ncbi:MAG: hypothetical protein IPI73_03875 [Betaproteobacteria bacterium]|nr:hypothetical protein [Betaproteobacteria bacterium]
MAPQARGGTLSGGQKKLSSWAGSDDRAPRILRRAVCRRQSRCWVEEISTRIRVTQRTGIAFVIIEHHLEGAGRWSSHRT